MPRKKSIIKKELPPDPRFNNVLVTKFVNSVMSGGKKSTAEGIVYNSIQLLAEKTGQDGLSVLKTALNNVKPVLEVKSRRVGGATYQVPVEIRPERRTALAIRWLLVSAKARSEKTMADKLAGELLAASKNEGGAVKKREETHRMAEANKAFAHYRW
ncbi:MAG: 30S ribosomal protein S7 [Candidatus Eisenbacteria bacterium]|nr:30S ribosomal protein S7 [Candidatus Eisenbacteria bacterium]